MTDCPGRDGQTDQFGDRRVNGGLLNGLAEDAHHSDDRLDVPICPSEKGEVRLNGHTHLESTMISARLLTILNATWARFNTVQPEVLASSRSVFLTSSCFTSFILLSTYSLAGRLNALSRICSTGSQWSIIRKRTSVGRVCPSWAFSLLEDDFLLDES